MANFDSVNSPWRHVRTRLYFTSASHMYTLLNVIKLGVNSILIDKSDEDMLLQIEEIIRLGFMSNFVFRLFENLELEEDDPLRFKFEIKVNRGAVVRSLHEDEEEISKELDSYKLHTQPIRFEDYVNINKRLSFEDINNFFSTLTTCVDEETCC